MRILTLRRSWRKLLPNFSTGADENVTDIAKDVATEFSNIFSTFPGFENCGIKEIVDWLNCDIEDACFQLRNDEEIIAEIRHSPKEDEEGDDDEGENDSQVKISNNDAFECFSKGLAWLEQQEQCDSSELMLLRKLPDRAARQRMTNPLKSLFVSK
ncbi:hypothetical protein AVEN_19111-1 [Araneus ventricosus]|uniref:DDE-1 domain-containing protein n=1 Tax=Araneus ventricosus TaxID=182803 RepID=A0A4Y1ZTI4_ARAVE|nr:hypothetical protein AVEN_19111-1 [Araneus ventricosus]